MIRPANYAFGNASSLPGDRARIRLAIAGSIILHGLLALLLSLFMNNWLLSPLSITLPQSNRDIEISILHRMPRQEIPVQQRTTLAIPITRPSIETTLGEFVAEEEPTAPLEESAVVDSIAVAHDVLKTKVDSLFALLDKYPELKRVVFHELLIGQPLPADSTENFRLALGRSLARFYEGSAQYGIIQRKDAFYVSPYDPFRPHGLTNSVDIVGLILAIVELTGKLTGKP